MAGTLTPPAAGSAQDLGSEAFLVLDGTGTGNDKKRVRVVAFIDPVTGLAVASILGDPPLLDPRSSLIALGRDGGPVDVQTLDVSVSNTLTAGQAQAAATGGSTAVALPLGNGQQSWIAEIGGTFSSGTQLAFEASTDPLATTTDWKSIAATVSAGSGGTGADILTVNGGAAVVVSGRAAGWAQVRVRAVTGAFTGGDSVTVTLRASTATRHVELVGGKDAAGNQKVSAASGAPVAISSGPSALTASTDASYTFASAVRHLYIENNSTVDVNFNLDAAASAGTYKVPASGGARMLDLPCTVLHLWSTGTPNVNGSTAGNVVVGGWA